MFTFFFFFWKLYPKLILLYSRVFSIFYFFMYFYMHFNIFMNTTSQNQPATLAHYKAGSAYAFSIVRVDSLSVAEHWYYYKILACVAISHFFKNSVMSSQILILGYTRNCSTDSNYCLIDFFSMFVK